VFAQKLQLQWDEVLEFCSK